ncbi:hypothetical protein A2856_00090 [Candidatus Uhrbacteria bacterium RIFCSPHIGHO2_01_FULL_63_20]|uniref:Guanylate cyclase domain-containing protein n=1 Tax=Candidatus Uhrbacteria bacterium RIFCSPHIGHO2_01_FULL_63_20 TaxID=1802385 RepID=A0A1F7TLN2_9BACT|nr:MAG: hypothetical protein A2856_00090 [Candidatus Uhrbacteria bacterium RIFCSPHIGHO2_01_FULL_63_20]
MPQAIVLLDLKGFSSLNEEGQKAVFTELLPEAARLLEKEGGTRPLDANTWGDSIIAVFDDTRDAAKFALAIRNLVMTHEWKEKALSDLAIRIAMHVQDLEKGDDPVRSLARSGEHRYGPGIVIPARIEPMAATNQIWCTEEVAQQLQPAISNKNLRARLAPIGRIELLKGAGSREVYWLGGDKDDPPANVAALQYSHSSPEARARLFSLRGINDYVERFHHHSVGLPASKLKASFKRYHHAILKALRLPARREGKVSRLEADVLELDDAGKLKMVMAPTNPEHKKWVPPMKLAMNAAGGVTSPGKKCGVAVYSVWKNIERDLGVAVAPDVHESTDIVYFGRKSSKDQEIGSYEIETVPGIYRPAKDDEKPPYRAILSAAILRSTSADSDPDGRSPFKPVGVLNITSSLPNAFSLEDCAWAEAAASLLGSLYQTCVMRSEALEKVRVASIPPTRNGKKRRPPTSKDRTNKTLAKKRARR